MILTFYAPLALLLSFRGCPESASALKSRLLDYFYTDPTQTVRRNTTT